MNLSESLEKVDAVLAEKLAVYEARWQEAVAGHQKSEQDLAARQEIAATELAKSIQDDQVKLSDDLKALDAQARSDADAERKAIIDAFDKKQAELLAAEQAELLATSEKLSEEALAIEEMRGLSAEDIAADWRKTQVVAVAKYLKLKSSGKEIDVAGRIVEALKLDADAADDAAG